MMFTFRFRIEVAPGCSISSDEKVLRLYETPSGQLVELMGEQGIATSARLVLKAQGWTSADDAAESGNRFSDVLALALLRHRIGAELWARRRSGMFFTAGLRMLEEQSGQRVLNDHKKDTGSAQDNSFKSVLKRSKDAFLTWRYFHEQGDRAAISVFAYEFHYLGAAAEAVRVHACEALAHVRGRGQTPQVQ